MTLIKDLRKTVTDATPVYAVVGATDVAVEKLRSARARAAKGPILDTKQVSTRVQQAPLEAMALTLGAAQRVEETYGELALRGKKLVDRVQRQQATQDLLAQGKVTISRGKAAATALRRGIADTRPAAKSTLTVAKRDASGAAADARRTAHTRTAGTKTAAKRTATTAKTRTARVQSATKATVTSAGKTAAAASKATDAAAAKIGE